MSTTSRGRKLVIVESPAKAKTIAGYLGAEYDVEASVGHIRDLPQPSELPPEMKKGPYGKFAVDTENGFHPYYVVDADKKKKVAELKKLLANADELYLATDEDREGEAIAWHLLEALRPKVPVKRMVFHEITREALERALATTRDIDDRLVDAQETRRIMDRLYGYEVSPVLWRKIRQGLSAGRVQSVATRLVVERERERMAFRSASYWDVTGTFAPVKPPQGEGTGGSFEARLTAVDGIRVATGRDFTDRGVVRHAEVVHLDEAAANALAAGVTGAPVSVRSVEEKPYTRRPAAPFTTSTLQQEAGRKLRFSSRQAMRIAQSLYENGFITYMRTDSTTLSNQALTAARSQASELYGPQYVPDAPRVYSGKAKNAQEAHEAIRPAGDRFRTPAQVANQLRGDEFRLYELIWKRTVASQMADARGSTASVRLAVEVSNGRSAEFSASGTVITFRGFLAAYEEGRDAGRGEEDATADAARDAERRLPPLTVGDRLTADDVTAAGHETSPPPRYTEASLVKALEEKGIGRPSTYASTISTIIDRGYVWLRRSALVPSWTAFAVTRLMEQHFERLVDYDFTAELEGDLDRIASGEQQRVAWLQQFYFGDGDDTRQGLQDLASGLEEIDARGISTVPLGEDVVLRVGRYGPYVEVIGPDGEPMRATVPDDIAPDEMTVEKARELLTMSGGDGRVLGPHPESTYLIVVKSGRYGPYVTEVIPEPESQQSEPASQAATDKPAKRTAKKATKPKGRTASLFKDMSPETVTLDDAVRLLSLPRMVGVDPETEVEITAQNGRFGPYLKRGTDSRSLATEAQLFEVTLEQALQIYAEPKRRGRAAQPPLRELGIDPVSERPIIVKDGRFGPYVTDGETNATLRSGDDPEAITPERAAELLADKRAKGPTKRAAKKTAKKATKKTSAKMAVKKVAAKKATEKATTKKVTAQKIAV
ncbi:MAG: type I DNA topoisomerase [Actinomycetota bacterium]